MDAIALVGHLALLALAALAGWYARSWDNDEKALDAVAAWKACALALRAQHTQPDPTVPLVFTGADLDPADLDRDAELTPAGRWAR